MIEVLAMILLCAFIGYAIHYFNDNNRNTPAI